MDPVFGEDDALDRHAGRLNHEEVDQRHGRRDAVAVDVLQVLLHAAVALDRGAELGESGRARPCRHAGEEPEQERAARRADVVVDLRGGGEDPGADLRADEEGEGVEERELGAGGGWGRGTATGKVGSSEKGRGRPRGGSVSRIKVVKREDFRCARRWAPVAGVSMHRVFGSKLRGSWLAFYRDSWRLLLRAAQPLGQFDFYQIGATRH